MTWNSAIKRLLPPCITARIERIDTQRGATVIEYAMVAFFISIAAFSIIVQVGTSVSGVFQTISHSF
ncbi:MAG: Flp family type IVb pilin [Alphaproteobacteria bacterium]|nr:Flp family type IVb pilin [Alphaproteobacteria bacterium]MBV9553592.1 Flp family type IVb pilin [Alphaproteobacteria bacterium]